MNSGASRQPSSTMTSHRSTLTRSAPVQVAAGVIGVAFLLVGIAGFVPGITTHYSQMSFAEHDSGAMLLGVFGVSVLHNLVHIAFGVAGIALSRTASLARSFLVVGGLIYAVLTVYGALIDQHSNANLVPVNTADNWLHLALAAAMLGLGFGLARRQRPSTPV